MSILEQIEVSAIDTDVEVKERHDVLRRVAQLAKTSKILKKVREEDILHALEARERLGSTGFGDGIAIPHCSFSEIDDFVVGFCRIREGVNFASLDGKPVYIVFFIIGPQNQRNRHIQILSTSCSNSAQRFPTNLKTSSCSGGRLDQIGCGHLLRS